jgi:tetratricopeptide (TPR) repeat protein
LLVTTRWAGESDSVEVSHETLIRHWGQLRTWLNQDRELLLWRERFRALFNEWRRNPKDHTTLLRGGLLVEAQRWLSQRGEVLPLQERHFIAESARIQQESTQREQKRVERELQQRRRATRRLWFALVSVAIAFAAVCALYYIRQWLASVRNQAVLASDADFAIAERLAQQDPSNTQWQRDLSASHELRGDLLFQQGKASEALQHYQASRAILERLVQKDSSNAEWQQYLAETDYKVAFTLYVLRNVDDALQTYEAGRAIAARLVQQDPNNARWQRILSSFHASIGRVLELQDKLPEALQAYEASRGIAERLAQQDPTNAQWKNELSFVRERVAEVRRRQQEPAGGSGQRK